MEEQKKATGRKGKVGQGQEVEGQPKPNTEATPGFVPDSEAPAKEPPAGGSTDRGDVEVETGEGDKGQ
jgi:hypothetical protein